LGERHNGIVEVKGSNPFGSTILFAINQGGTAESFSSLKHYEMLTKGIFCFSYGHERDFSIESIISKVIAVYW
jgi:hypothetical protein